MRRLVENAWLALTAGLALRLFFVFHFSSASDDTAVYEELATNWLKHGVYGVFTNGRLVPADLRTPGYPAFLAAIYALSGRSGETARTGVMLAQVAVDLLTCLLIACLAFLLASGTYRRRRTVACLALWLAATCPFIANYAAVPLTEVIAAFFTAVALLLLAALIRLLCETDFVAGGDTRLIRAVFALLGLGAAFFSGVGALFRPETPLLLIAAWSVLAWVLWRKRLAMSWVRSVVLMGIACLAPLAPWVVRNGVTLHEFQLLTPPYAQLPGELVPRGFIAWEKTWLYRFRDVYLVSWKLDGEAIDLKDIPDYAFDSARERQRVGALLERYNQTLTLSPAEDAAFEEIAHERTARRPIRTYLEIPLFRAATMWFTPRIELLPYSGKVSPLAQAWEEDPLDLSMTIGFFLLNLLYVFLALWGAACVWGAQPELRAVVAFLALFVVLRTAFLTTLETPEPRYVIVCFPVILALAAQVWPQRETARYRSSGGSG